MRPPGPSRQRHGEGWTEAARGRGSGGSGGEVRVAGTAVASECTSAIHSGQGRRSCQSSPRPRNLHNSACPQSGRDCKACPPMQLHLKTQNLVGSTSRYFWIACRCIPHSNPVLSDSIHSGSLHLMCSLLLARQAMVNQQRLHHKKSTRHHQIYIAFSPRPPQPCTYLTHLVTASSIVPQRALHVTHGHGC